jgi:hypothetical protein
VTPRRAADAAERVLVWAAIAFALLGTSVWVLTAPQVTSGLVSRYYVRASGLDDRTAVDAAEQVRRFVTDPDAPALPATVSGRPAFDAPAVSHLVDVRRVLRGAGLAAAIAWLLLVAWGVTCAAKGRTARIPALVSGGGWAVLVTVGVAALAGSSDFDGLFVAFHGLLFPAGTWTFPSDSLLIQLFPETVWAVLGGTWGGLVALAGVALVLGARVLRGRLVRK